MSEVRVENAVATIEFLTDFLINHFEDFPVHNEELLLDLVVSIDTNEVEKYFEKHGLKCKKDNFEFLTYDFVNLMRLYSDLCKALGKGDLDGCDVIIESIYQVSHVYMPKILDEQVLTEFKEWNFNTYGPGERLTGTIEHIKNELEEIEKEPHDLVEWVDVMMLAINGALRHGHEPQAIIDAFHKKFDINKKRKWKDWREVPEGEPITHIKE